jgi:hypothetical protein
MNTYTFTLILDGLDLEDEQRMNALFEAGCDDALFGLRNGTPIAEFDREAPSFSEAVMSAIRTVEGVADDLRVVRVEPDDLVTLAVIAERVGRSRQNVQQYASGTRGPGDFPSPLAQIDGSTRVWEWSTVSAWFAEQLGLPALLGGGPQFIAALNGVLDARRKIAELTSIIEHHGGDALDIGGDEVAALPRMLDEEANAVQRELSGV